MASRSLLSGSIKTSTTITGARAMARRTFMQGSVMALKESHSKDPNPEEFDKHKQDSLAKQRAGKGHWKPELASQSEENVKADRMGPGEASEAAMKRLQDRTKEAAEETSKHGTSMRDGL